MSRVVKPRVGYTDLLHQPEDGRRYEIDDGEVFVVPSPLPIHQIVGFRIAQLLDAYAARHGGRVITSPLDIVFSEYNVLQPDVVFFSAARRHLVSLREPIRHPPDLVIEVLSPSTQTRDRGVKLQTFSRFAVPEYWIVDPDAGTIDVLKLQGHDYVATLTCGAGDDLASPTLDGLRFPVATLFASL